ncbi:MATE family efflux transporter [Shewanella atlantica]|uniref:MATE family efflux transporter n=1 Tax=Shewanella atlantica TaxID=271099 RepID=UPI003735B201
MQADKPDISQDRSIQRTFWRYAIPSIAAMLVNGLYQIIDGMFIGHYLGYEGLAGINVAWPIIYVIAGVGLMIGMGAGSLNSVSRGKSMARNRGSTETCTSHAEIATTLYTALGLAIGFGVIFSYLLFVNGTALLLAQGAEDQALLLAQDYISPFVWTAVITILASALPILVRNDESPNIATTLMVIGACTNIVLDYLFIVQFDMGLKGAALATVSAQLSVCLGGIAYFLSGRSQLRLSAYGPDFNSRLSGRILLLGSSSFVMYIYTSFVFALHNRLFMEYGSSITVAAFAIVGYLMVLYYFIAEGIGEGMQPPVSFFLGAAQPHNIKKMVLLAATVSLTIGLSWAAVLNLFPEYMIGLFNSDDTALIQETVTGIHLHLFAMFLDGLIVLATMYFMAVNQGGKSLAISLGNMLIQLPFLYMLPKWLGVYGVWVAMPLSNVVMFCIVAPMVWYHMNAATHKQVPSLATA